MAWTNFLLKISLLDSLHVHSLPALQFVVDRLLKKLISMKNEDRTKMRMAKKLSTLTLREQNAVYYMSGYIAVKNIKRFKKRSPNCQVQQKWQMFAQVLMQMRAENQADNTLIPPLTIPKPGLIRLIEEGCTSSSQR